MRTIGKLALFIVMLLLTSHFTSTRAAQESRFSARDVEAGTSTTNEIANTSSSRTWATSMFDTVKATQTISTPVSGIITSNTTWTAANSPYLVTGNILVNNGVTLTIEPGVTVWFSATRSLQVLGTLIARGTAAQPITFTSSRVQGQQDDWGAIIFADTAVSATFDAAGNYLSGSALQYATVEYAGSGSLAYAVDAPSTAVYVDHCTIRDNGAGGLRVGGRKNYITDNAIRNNSGGNGIVNSGSLVAISGNTISGNTSGYNGGGIWNFGSFVAIRDNVITSNSASTGCGGGILNNGSSVTIYNNTLTDNSALANCGGGISNVGVSSSISGNTISGNSATIGGGVHNSASLVTISDNTVTRNSALWWGGGIAWMSWDSSGNIAYNTIITNTSPGSNGGIYVYYGYPTINYNILQNNSGYAIYNKNDFSPTHLDARYNWWGTVSDAAIQGMIYDWNDDITKSFVDYAPFLTSSVLPKRYNVYFPLVLKGYP